MSTLGQRIAALIASQGPISIAQYMTLALHDPRAGYYATRDPLGEGGDFITAPEVSQMFGELIGLWLAQVWMDGARPAKPRLIELGPGRGTLIADVLRALTLVPDLRNQLEVVLVEMSPALRKTQERALQDCGVPVCWVDSLGDIARDRPVYVLANEFFDALPIRQYVKKGDDWFERMVTADAEGALGFALSPVALPGGAVPASRAAAPDGGVYETSAAGEALMEEIARAITAQGGAALIVDYGYDVPGFGETLQAMKRHGYADVLGQPGENDLTAHVDFAALRAAAARGGVASFGPLPQGTFLKRLGIEARAAKLGGEVVRRQLARLTASDQMGALFKALAVLPHGAPTPTGF